MSAAAGPGRSSASSGVESSGAQPPAADARHTLVTFGSAHLLVQRMPEDVARAVLHAALHAGATRLDTAPLYGHGGSEELVAAVAAVHGSVAVTTKVGLEPSPAPPAWRWAAGRVLRSLPGVADAVRGLRARLGPAAPSGIDPQAAGPSGRFGNAAVRQSIERSLHRLGRIDRLLLHEVHPADISDDLLRLLRGYQHRGDVATLGVATGNAVTLQALQRGQGLFTVAHISADALRPPLLPELMRAAADEGRALHLAGHGVLGAEARTLAHLRRHLRDDAALAAHWHAAVAGTRFADAGTSLGGRDAGNRGDGLAAALCARAAAQGFTELLVATSRPARVAGTVQAAALAHAGPLPAAAAAVLDQVFRTTVPAAPHPAPAAQPGTPQTPYTPAAPAGQEPPPSPGGAAP